MSSYPKSNIWSSLDWLTVSIYILMIVAGWFMIYAAGYNFDNGSIFNLSGRAGMQMIWIGVSIMFGFVILLIEDSFYDIFAYWIYIFVIFLLIVTIFAAPDIKGSRSWLVIGPLRLQAAEFAKFATALAVARFMNDYKFELMRGKNFAGVLCLIFLPMILILLQKETGSALIFMAFFIMLYREGMPGSILFICFCAILYCMIALKLNEIFWGVTPLGEYAILVLILLFIYIILYNYPKGRPINKYIIFSSFGLIVACVAVSFFVEFNLCPSALTILVLTVLAILVNYIRFRIPRYLHIIFFAAFSIVYLYSVDYFFNDILEPYQQTRVKVALHMIDDPGGAGYNVNQSKIAIGSGGFFGKGYLNGTQTKLKYVPEQDTDFIFCTVSEEEGFLGASIILLLFTTLIVRLIFLAEKQHTRFNRIYGYSVAAILTFHLVVNIGMVIGIMPVIGIPLPFFSYGGSSICAFTILLFIFLRLDAGKKRY
ncbi:MAG: rod shape-determining protein RodA [Dysgonamonadaceae bacterium]|jgi:rod shape determining protein RodA|nr:rod shape-determining protein RodA [Dysgonamonadaceae bacterium]